MSGALALPHYPDNLRSHIQGLNPLLRCCARLWRNRHHTLRFFFHVQDRAMLCGMGSQPPIFDLSTPCPSCGHKIEPAEIVRPGFELVQCPKCGVTFEPAVRRAQALG
jgi:predicted RNA-binding Zn-ribbon protein involved in translation (DUF1610 family)